MGYYNFYKIIKDIIKTLFGSRAFRILLIIAIVFVILFNLGSISFGSYEFKGISKNYTLPDEFSDYKYIVIFGARWNVYAVASNSEIYIWFDNSNNVGVGTKESNASYIYCVLNNNNLTDFSSSTINSGVASNYIEARKYYSIAYIGGGSSVYASNYNVKNSLTNEVVFDNTNFSSPYFTPSASEIQTLTWNTIFVEPSDFGTDEPLYVHNLLITQTVTDDENTYYYYSDDLIALTNDSSYYKQYFDSDYYYYSIPKNKFNFKQNSKYLLVLSSSPQIISNSVGLVDTNYSGVFDVVSIDTTNLITSADETNDTLTNIDDTLNENTVSGDTKTDVEDSLNFDNQNTDLNNMNNGFFSRLTTMLSNLLGYDLSEDTVIRIPYPHSQKYLELHSNILYNNITGGLRLIINAFWIYLFAFYMYKFINKLYIAISTGNILDTFSSSGEVITNNML